MANSEQEEKDLAVEKTHLVLVNGIVVKDDKILISKRSMAELHQPGMWTIPGGKVERTEGDVWNIVEQTLFDELREETGIEVEEEPALLTNNTFIRNTGQHVVALVFICNWKARDPQPLEDTTDVHWVSQGELGNYKFAPNVASYLERGFNHIKKKKDSL